MIYDWLQRNKAPDAVFLHGVSLGSGVAVQLAAAHGVDVKGVILEAPYTTLPDVGALHYPFLPVRWFMFDTFRSIDHIKGVRAPVLMLHGGRDNVIPARLGKRLFEAANEPKRWAFFPDGNHIDLFLHGGKETVLEFIQQPG